MGRFYEEDGKPTKEMARVAQKIALAKNIKQKQKEDEMRFPSCSSQWNAQDGGQVRFWLLCISKRSVTFGSKTRHLWSFVVKVGSRGLPSCSCSVN